MVLDDNNSQIGIEFARRKPRYIYWMDSNWNIKNESSVRRSSYLSYYLAIRICVFVEKQPPQSAYRVKDYSVLSGCFDLSRFIIETSCVNLI